MSTMQFVVIVVAASIGVIAWARWMVKRNLAGGYHRQFSGPALRRPENAPPRDDTAFPFASTLYLGDGGASASHHHHPDCPSPVDVGAIAGCSDGGGGSGGH